MKKSSEKYRFRQFLGRTPGPWTGIWVSSCQAYLESWVTFSLPKNSYTSLHQPNPFVNDFRLSQHTKKMNAMATCGIVHIITFQ